MDILSTSTILAIVLFVLGIIVSYYIAKYQMRKNKIVHFFINEYDIGKGLSDEFPNFNLHYGNEHLNENVKVLKGGIINVGRNDISGLNGKTDINLFLPEDYKIIDISVYPVIEDLKVEANIDEEKVNQVNFGIGGILKSKEYFKYTIITEAPKDSEEIMELLKFKHRIPNTEKITNTFVGLPSSIRNKKRKLHVLVWYLVLFSILSAALFLKQPIRVKVLEKNTQKEVSISLNYHSEIFVEDRGLYNFFGSVQKITSKELVTNYNFLPQTTYDFKEFLPVICMPFLFMCLLLFLYYHTLAKHSHIIRIVMKDERKKNAGKVINIIPLLKRIIQNI